MNWRRFLVTFIIIFQMVPPVSACTTGMADGTYTENGRALLWKNRDSSNDKNELVLFNYGDIRFIGLINANDTTQVWAGVNQAGFAIMNAESRDMAQPGENTQYDDEGYLMKQALMECETIDDFEQLLKSTNEAGRAVTSNFGVLDASGKTVFFETGNYHYIRIDSKDEENSGDFLVRANYAKNCGMKEEQYGFIRYDNAVDKFKQAAGNLNYRYIISEITDDIDLPDSVIKIQKYENYRRTQLSVNRYRSVAVAVFESVKPGENSEMTTFWCTLGEPSVSVAIPLWLYSGKLPAVVNGDETAPLNALFLQLKSLVYDHPEDNSQMNLEKARILRRKMDKIQKKVFKMTDKELSKWRQQLPDAVAVAEFQEKIACYVFKQTERILKQLTK